MVILTDDTKLKTMFIVKKVEKSIELLPNYIKETLSKLHMHICICDIFKETGVKCQGCYYITDNCFQKAIILIDKFKVRKIESTLYHEIGHLLDDLIGCKSANNIFDSKNAKQYRFSRNNEMFIQSNLSENDFFIQCKNSNERNAIFYYDLQEAFADCFAEIMLGKRYLKMQNTKFIVKQAIIDILGKST